jgi:2-iminobutanoate/2-iminopropanoate deaminase
MEKRSVAAADAAPAVGPYSPAVVAGDLVFVSGQVPLDRQGQVVGDGAAEQARQALANLVAQLRAAGLGPEAVVKTTIYLTDMDDFAAVNEAYAAVFAPPYPARSTVQVARLPKDVKVEIEALAVRG